MSRNTARKIARSPNAMHSLVKRDQAGSVVMNTALSTAVSSVTSNSPASVTTRLSDPGSVGWTSATAKLTSAGSAATVKIKRGGTTLTSATTGTTGGTITATTSGRHTTPLQGPSFTLTATVTGGTASLSSATVKREDHWV